MRLSPRLDDLIPVPHGGELRALRDAGNFIDKLPKREHGAPAWDAAIEAFMLVAEHGGDTHVARIGIMRALWAPTLRKKAGGKISGGRQEAELRS
jgi:hypothetical protein